MSLETSFPGLVLNNLVIQFQDFLDLFIHLPVWKLLVLVYRLVQHETEIKNYNNEGNSNLKR